MFEDGLITSFKQHPVFRFAPKRKLPWMQRYLLELGALSDHFVRLNERARYSVSCDQPRSIFATIINEEIPSGKPSHQQERVHDMMRIWGVSLREIVNHTPSAITRTAIQCVESHLAFSPGEEFGILRDIRLVTFFRMYGEILVAEQFRLVVNEMRRRLRISPQANSRYYWPHFLHDQKWLRRKEQNHVNLSDAFLEKHINSEEALTVAMKSAQDAHSVRYLALMQFVHL